MNDKYGDLKAIIIVEDSKLARRKIFGLPMLKHLYYALRAVGIKNIEVICKEGKGIGGLLNDVKIFRSLSEITPGNQNLVIYSKFLLDRNEISSLLKECNTVFYFRDEIVAIFCDKRKFNEVLHYLETYDLEKLKKAFRSKQVACLQLSDVRSIKIAEEKIKERVAPGVKQITIDGFITRHINRKVSLRITKLIADTNITPNQITIFATLLMMFGASLLLLKLRIYTAIAGFIIQLACIIDGCDGEIARLKYLQSDKGAFLDLVLDRYADAFTILMLTITQPFTLLNVVVGMLALFGVVIRNYVSSLAKFILGNYFAGVDSRDIRCFLIFVFCLLGEPFLALLAIALLTNVVTLCRVIKVAK